MRILTAMSGGVDSSVAAKLLRDAGHECIGCTMKLYDNSDAGVPKGHTCCSLDDTADARSVAYRLGMRYYVFNFAEDFREQVIGRFAGGYLRGITPNPCIDCNRYMKFGKLFQRARELGCDHVATGHYARILFDGEKYLLKKGADKSKDQSYVLYFMTQDQLAWTLFPLGDLHKSEVRRIAAGSGFVTAAKPDSQDICFAPDGDYAGAIERYSGQISEPGDFVSADGSVLGRHRGIVHYTVGQHRGLGLGLPERRYVCSICPEENKVVLGGEEELLRREFFAGDFNWISGEAPAGALRCRVKVRYRHREQPAEAFPQSDGTVRILFDESQRAVTPGQSAVLYSGDTVLGGGVIL